VGLASRRLRIRCVIVGASCLLLPGVLARAQEDPCAELLRQGIKNNLRERSAGAYFDRKTEAMCSKYTEVRKNQESHGASFDLKVVIKVPIGIGYDTDMSAESLLSIGSVLCQSSDQVTDTKSLVERSYDFVDKDAVQAWKQCQDQERKALRVSTKYFEDDVGVRGVTVSMYYTIAANSVDQSIKSIVSKGGLVCEGDLWKTFQANAALKKDTPLSTSVQTITCTRQLKSPFEEGGRKIRAEAARLVIGTSATDVTRDLPAIVVPPPPPPTVEPIGGVVAFSGAIDSNHQPPTGWLVCDGAPLRAADFPHLYSVVGTAYGDGKDANGNKVGDFNLPDYRGYFLRGLDSGARRDPEWQRAIGSKQGDDIKPHRHVIGLGGADSTTMVPGGGTQRLPHFVGDGFNAGPPKMTDSAGNAESRPLNVAVYYLIRVK
jgi:hypothetical protein